MDNTVVCRNLSKVYRQNAVAVEALTDINLEVPKKDFLCLSGPSGSGKSTLLNLIGGLDKPTSAQSKSTASRSPLSTRARSRGCGWNASVSCFRPTT